MIKLDTFNTSNLCSINDHFYKDKLAIKKLSNYGLLNEGRVAILTDEAVH